MAALECKSGAYDYFRIKCKNLRSRLGLLSQVSASPQQSHRLPWAATEAAELVELGSGAGRKIRLLLAAMADAGRLERCVLLDINARFLSDATRALAADFPGLAVRGVVGDFLDDLDLRGPGGGRLAGLPPAPGPG